MQGIRSASSVDIEAGEDGSFHVAYGIPGMDQLYERGFAIASDVILSFDLSRQTTTVCVRVRLI